MKKVYINAYIEDDDVTIGIRSEVYFEGASKEEEWYFKYFTETAPLPFNLMYYDGSVYKEDLNIGSLPLTTSFDTPHIHVIEDWTGERLFPDKVFDSYEAGWEFVYEHVPNDDDDDGVYEDIYVVPKTKKHG